MRSNASQSFSTSCDSTTKIISTLVVILFVVVAAVTQSLVAAGLGVASIILAYAYSPRGYTLSGRSIVVKRIAGHVHLPLDGIREARKSTADDFSGCFRLWGSGGLFGYYGLFRTSKLGKCTWYVTNRKNAVVVVTDAKTAVFSPDDVDGFVQAIHASVQVPQVMSGDLLRDTRRSWFSGNLAGKVIGATVGIAGIAVAAFALLYAPGPPSYTLTPETLTIHDRFYPVTLSANAVDAGQIRIVDLTVDTDWRPTTRTNGFANSHYRSGWFRVANGKKIRMYRADSMRLVLLPPKGEGAPVLMEVSQPEKFMEQVRHMWARHL